MNLNEVAVDDNFKLIVTIVSKGLASRAVSASKQAGAEGGTIILGRGTCKKSAYASFLIGSEMQEKEIILTLVRQDKAEQILEAISEDVKLNEPCNGVAFIVNVKSLIGIVHLLGCKDK